MRSAAQRALPTAKYLTSLAGPTVAKTRFGSACTEPTAEVPHLCGGSEAFKPRGRKILKKTALCAGAYGPG